MRMRHVWTAAWAAAVVGSSLHAQERLVGGLAWTFAPTQQRWTFATPLRHDSLDVTGVRQTVVPLFVALDVGTWLTIDATTAYASGAVITAGAERRALSGPTDTKLRTTLRLLGDNVVLTGGVNLPTGAVRLNAEQGDALRVLGAPALGLQAPVLGVGAGATAGVVLAHRIRGLAIALGSAIERRGAYTPLENTLAGVRSPTELDPGEAVHLSLGLDGITSHHSRASLLLSATLYGEDQVNLPGATGGPVRQQYRLGPSAAAAWRVQANGGAVKDFNFALVGRYRAPFEDAEGVRVEQSEWYAADAAFTWLVGPSIRKGVTFGFEGHYQSGLAFDNTITTSAFVGGGGMLGFVVPVGPRMTAHPSARVGYGRIDVGGVGERRSNATSVAVGLTLSGR